MGPRVNPSKTEKSPDLAHIFFKRAHFLKKIKYRKIGPRGAQLFPGPKVTSIQSRKTHRIRPTIFFRMGPILPQKNISETNKKKSGTLQGGGGGFSPKSPHLRYASVQRTGTGSCPQRLRKCRLAPKRRFSTIKHNDFYFYFDVFSK